MNFARLTISAFALAALAAGCATTDTMTLAEKRDAVDEAIVQQDGKEVAVSDADYDPNEIVCKTVKSTGTRLGRARDCRTAEEWRQTMTEANRAITSLQDNKGGLGTKME